MPLSFFDVPFQPQFLLHEFITRSSRLCDYAAERSSWLQGAGWHALRTTAHCENAMPVGSLPGFLRETWRELTESAISSHQCSPASVTSLRCGRQPRRSSASALRSPPLDIGDIRISQALKIVMDQGFLILVGHFAARRVNPWIRLATQYGTLAVTLADEDPEGLCTGLPLLSPSSSDTSTLASTPRDRAWYGLRGERLGEADRLGPEMEARLGVCRGTKGLVISSRCLDSRHAFLVSKSLPGNWSRRVSYVSDGVFARSQP